MSVPRGYDAGTFAGSAPWASATRSTTTIGTTATVIPTTALTNRKGIYVFNAGTVNVFLAFTSTVATSNEVILYPSQGLFLPLTDAVSLYGIVASGAPVVVSWEYTPA